MIVGADALAGNTPMRKRTIPFAALILGCFVLCVINVLVGSVKVPVLEVFKIVASFGSKGNDTYRLVIWDIRLPRVIASFIGGGCLAMSGLLLQVFFRNPIVGPFILGVSSGAGLVVALTMLTSIQFGFAKISPYVSTVAGFLGAYGVLTLVLGVAARVKSTTTLLIVGLMIGYLCHASTGILIALAEREKVKGFVLWQMGSFSGMSWSEVTAMFWIGLFFSAASFLLSKPLNAFLLGESYAATMGVNVRFFRLAVLMCSCGLAGMVTALAGPVAFVGLAVPHAVRLLFATSDNRILIPATLLFGAIVSGGCDLLARQLISPVELPLSSITAIFGAPVVIGLLLRRRASL